MKTLIFALTMVMGLSAQAHAPIGSWEKYLVTEKSRGQIEQTFLKNTSLDIKPNGKVDLLYEKFDLNGNLTLSLKLDMFDVDDLGNQEKSENIIFNCVVMGGTLETVNVPAGAFDTCRLKDVQTDVVLWYAPITLGVAKSQLVDADNDYEAIYELVDWSR